jgi:hypothetical protein
MAMRSLSVPAGVCCVCGGIGDLRSYSLSRVVVLSELLCAEDFRSIVGVRWVPGPVSTALLELPPRGLPSQWGFNWHPRWSPTPLRPVLQAKPRGDEVYILFGLRRLIG